LGDNWALKSSNLRKLVRNLEHYYHDSLGKTADFAAVDLSKISRTADVDALSDLVFLVAAAAVTCPQKSEYVSRILNMPSDTQNEMKQVLQSSLARLSDYQPVDDGSVEDNEMVFDDEDDDEDHPLDGSERGDQDTSGGPKNLFGANHHSKEASEDLERDLAEARRELAAFRSQAGILQEDNEKAQDKLRAVVEDLQDRLVGRQDELIQVEEDLQGATSELEEIKSKLLEVEEQKSQLADDLDVASAKAQQLYKAEATLVAYKKKLESVGMMNQQMTDLEDQSANYLRQIMDLESEVKKSNTLQRTVTQLQEQITKLEKEKKIMTAASQASVTEIAGLKTRLNAAESAKKMYEEELSELRAQQEHAGVDVQSPAGQESLSMQNASAQVPADAKEKMMRLEIENKKLVEEMEMEALKLQSTTAAATAPVAAEPVKQLSSLAAAAKDSAEAANLKIELDRMQEELAVKEKENAKISSDKDKLEAYTKRTLAKFQDKYLVALQECKAKLKEKQDKIEVLETRSASERTAQKREERLLSSTIYELGLAIMQNKLKDR
jgi:DNA repair exonuclease SbcCD ATPase subunit